MRRLLLILVIAGAGTAAGTLRADDAQAHRSGCHRWHSCPSDYNTYTPGDLGYEVRYPGNCGYVNCGGDSPYEGSGSSGSGAGIDDPNPPLSEFPWFWILAGAGASLWLLLKLPGWSADQQRKRVLRKRAAAAQAARDLETTKFQRKHASSKWLSRVGDRLAVAVTVKSTEADPSYRYYGGQYRGRAVYRRARYAYELEDDEGNLLIWYTSSQTTVLEKGRTYLLRATVKEHDTVHGVERTVLKNAKIGRAQALAPATAGA